jgi:hypothetical protein
VYTLRSMETLSSTCLVCLMGTGTVAPSAASLHETRWVFFLGGSGWGVWGGVQCTALCHCPCFPSLQWS